MKINFSSHLFGYRPITAKQLSILPEFGFKNMELWGMKPHLDCANKNFMKKLASFMKDLGLKVVSFHGPFFINYGMSTFSYLNLSDPNKFWRNKAISELKRCADTMKLFGADTMVVHHIGDTTLSRREAEANFRLSLSELVRHTAPMGINIALENVLTEFSKTDRLRRFVESFGHPKVGICLDIGHANVNENPIKAIENCGSRMIEMHAADNMGMEDSHLVPYQGTLNWPVIYKMVKDLPHLKYFTIELMFPLREEIIDLDLYRKILQNAKDSLKRMRKEAKNLESTDG